MAIAQGTQRRQILCGMPKKWVAMMALILPPEASVSLAAISARIPAEVSA